MKRIIAWILVLASCIGLISVTAGAAQLPFTDVAADAYYAEPVAWAVEKGITNGMTETTFVPDGSCTRGQVVTFLYRYFSAAEDPQPENTMVITKQPKNIACAIGETATFTVEAPAARHLIPTAGRSAAMETFPIFRRVPAGQPVSIPIPSASAWDCRTLQFLTGTAASSPMLTERL